MKEWAHGDIVSSVKFVHC